MGYGGEKARAHAGPTTQLAPSSSSAVYQPNLRTLPAARRVSRSSGGTGRKTGRERVWSTEAEPVVHHAVGGSGLGCATAVVPPSSAAATLDPPGHSTTTESPRSALHGLPSTQLAPAEGQVARLCVFEQRLVVHLIHEQR
jgi:hypothetical protein